MPPRTRRGVGAASTGPSTPAAAAETQPPPTQRPEAQMAPPPVPAFSASTSASAPTSAPSRSFNLKPKIVRRADEERKALAEQEEKKFNDRAAEDARRRRAASRGRGRGRGRGGRGRGRGDFGGFGRDGLVRRVEAPDGPLSQGAVLLSRGGRAGSSLPGRYGGSSSAGGSGSGSGGGGLGARSGGGGGSGPIFSMASEIPEYDPRLNTDMFNSGRGAGYGSDDDGAVKNEYEYVASSGSSGAGSAAAGGKAKLLRQQQQQQLLPMGIQRTEHREPEVQVATTAELEAAEAAAAALAAGPAAATSLPADDDDDDDDDVSSDEDAGFPGGAGRPIEDDNEVWSRAIRTNRGVRLVDIDGQEIEVSDIDTLAEKRQEIAARKAAAEAAAAGTVVKQEEDETGAVVDGIPARPKKKRRNPRQAAAAAAAAAAARDPKNKDPEEVAIEEGLQVLLHDLALDAPGLDPDLPQPVAVDAAAAAAAGSGGDASRREGRLFLFQFPPVLPSLQSFAPSSRGDGQQRDGAVKREPGADNDNDNDNDDDDDDVVMLDSARPPATAGQAIDLTTGEASDSATAGEDGIGSGGFLGTLSVRQSGRTELSWGGMTFAMMPGADVQFLTTAVLLETADEKPPARHDPASAGRTTGHAFGMGPVGGKYNLVPVFSDETEWVVDPAELEGTDEGS